MKKLFNLFKGSVSTGLVGIFLLGVISIAGSGCQTMTGLYDPDKVTLQTEMEWLTPPLNMGLRDVSHKDKIVYLRLRNSSGSPVEGLYEKVAAKLAQAGYQVTQNVDEAHFSLVTDVRYFGETREKDGHKGLLTGAALGGIGGAVVGHNVGSGNRDKGALGGAVAGGLIGDALARRNKIITYSLAIDIRIGEKMENGVTTTRTASVGGQVSGDAAAAMGRRTERARDKAGSSQEQRVEVEEEFLYHNNRIVASAKKMNLTVDEAMPVVTGRVSTAIASVLP